MRDLQDLIEEHSQYLKEAQEAIIHWGQWCDSFEEAWDKADQYDVDLRGISDNEKWDIKRNFNAVYPHK